MASNLKNQKSMRNIVFNLHSKQRDRTTHAHAHRLTQTRTHTCIHTTLRVVHKKGQKHTSYSISNAFISSSTSFFSLFVFFLESNSHFSPLLQYSTYLSTVWISALNIFKIYHFKLFLFIYVSTHSICFYEFQFVGFLFKHFLFTGLSEACNMPNNNTYILIKWVKTVVSSQTLD